MHRYGHENTINYDTSTFVVKYNEYNKKREKEREEIKDLLSKGYKPIFPSRFRWFELGNKTFNGYSKEDLKMLGWNGK